MGKKKGFTFKHLDFLIIDTFSMAISLVVAYVIRFRGIFNVYSVGDYTTLGMGLFLAYIFMMLFNNYHSGILKRNAITELGYCIALNVEILIFTIAFLFLFKVSVYYSRLVIGLFFVLDVLIMWVLRSIRKGIVRRGYNKGHKVSNVIVATYSYKLVDFFNSLKKENTGYYNCIGILLLDEEKKAEAKKILIDEVGIGTDLILEKELLDFVKENVVNEAFIVADARKNEKLTDMFLNMGITVNVGMSNEIGTLSNVKVEKLGDYTMLSSSISAGTTGERIVKRMFDIVVGLIGLIFTGIFYIILAPIIKKQSPGPVFFSQDRVGKNGKVFKMYKFRSMYMDAEERKKELMDQNQMQGLMFKMDNDPRIMPIGRFIRKASIDEFPQFWNILKGDMSLVGTRPPTLDEYKQYSPYHLSRLAIKPGLTGMWQTSGRSEVTDFEEVVRLDNEYIRNFSLKLDVKIILKTFGSVLKMKGSV